jgi:hypothetical protein
MDVSDLIVVLRARLEERGFGLEIDLADPASVQDIAQCEEFLGVSLPASLRALLHKHNGISLQAYIKRQDDRDDDGYLTILSTADIIACTEVLWQQFADIRAQDSDVGDVPSRRLIYAIEIDEFDLSPKIDATHPSKSGEYPIVSFDSHQWPLYPPAVIAESASELVFRACEFMGKTAAGFAYWRLMHADGG